jgi:hypothetical protein
MKRPPSVWITLILLSIVSLLFLPALFTWTAHLFDSLWGSSQPPVNVWLFLAGFVLRLAACGFLVFSIIAIWKRWRQARIVGLAALLLVFALVAYAKLNPLPPGQGLPKPEFNSPAEQGGAFIMDQLAFVAFWILWFRFGFSAGSRRFFEEPNNAMHATCEDARA